MTNTPQFIEPRGDAPPRPEIKPENLRVKQPEPGPNETCDEYENRRLKQVCGKPAIGYVSLPTTEALPEGVRVALCKKHLELHNGRKFNRRVSK